MAILLLVSLVSEYEETLQNVIVTLEEAIQMVFLEFDACLLTLNCNTCTCQTEWLVCSD